MEQPPSLHTIKDALSQFYENLKAEVIVLDLLENKRISPNDFSVIHESTFSRGYRRDLTRVKICLLYTSPSPRDA